MHRTLPLVVDILVTGLAILRVHEELRIDRLAVERAGRTGKREAAGAAALVLHRERRHRGIVDDVLRIRHESLISDRGQIKGAGANRHADTPAPRTLDHPAEPSRRARAWRITSKRKTATIEAQRGRRARGCGRGSFRQKEYKCRSPWPRAGGAARVPVRPPAKDRGGAGRKTTRRMTITIPSTGWSSEFAT